MYFLTPTRTNVSVCEMPEEQGGDASESLQSPGPLQALLPQEYPRGEQLLIMDIAPLQEVSNTYYRI
jgi:hypothetical protein